MLCENPMDRSQQFLRDRGASSTSLSAHVLAFEIIYKQVPELMEPLFVSGISYTLCICHLPNHSAFPFPLTPVFSPTITRHVTHIGVYGTSEISL